MDVRVEVMDGEATAWRWRTDADDVPGGRRGSDVGAEEARVGFVPPLEAGDISPAAVDTLLVKDEMAQPVHEAASLG